MKFLIFSRISFEVFDPIALIESYCFQSDFYARYDLLGNRRVEDVNRIGARISRGSLQKCKRVTIETNDLGILKYDLDRFLELDSKTRDDLTKELSEKVIEKLLEIKGIGLSKATKVLHTLYPRIIPIIDAALQNEYHNKVNPQWTEEQSSQILSDYYNNFKEGDNWQNLTVVFDQTRSNNLTGLTKLRIFDILWWSYLKAKRLRDQKNINWSTIK